MSSGSALAPKNTSKPQERRLRRVVDLFQRSSTRLDNGGASIVPAIAPSGALETPSSVDEGPVVLCDGGESPEVDIFFVHGLMGDLRNTWQKNDILWPKDLLGTKLPKARIITYGYDADVVHLFSRTSKNTIFNHSQSLVKAVHRMKRSPSENKRPIVFVAHSLGGILVKDGLSWAKEQRGFSQVYEIFELTKGIVFLGTPHRGASGDYANFGVVLQRMTALFIHDSNRHLISSLKDDSETLSRLSESFARMLDNPPFVVHSFVEELPMTTVKGIGLVVDQSSGFIGSPREEKDFIHADHRSMCRFSNNQDHGYLKVESAIEDCYNHAITWTSSRNERGISKKDAQIGAMSTELILARELNKPEEGTDVSSAQDLKVMNDRPPLFDVSQNVLIVSTSETEKDLINRLVDYSRFVKDDLDQFRYSRIKTTCQWLLDEPKFKDWLTEPRPFLWLSGPAGFGKSFLTSKVVEFLKEKVGKDQQGGGNDALLVYFFCRATDATQRSLKNGMWAMIGQLADQDKEYAKEIGPLLKSTRTNSPQSSPTIPKIWRRFLHDFKHIFKRRPIFMVVDGLDECERTERQEFLQEAFRFCFENLDSLRIFCSSRPEVLREIDEIETPEERSIVPPTIVVSSQTKSDIECFVNAKLRRTRFAKDKKMRSKVQSSVVSNAKGMFLWADLTMKEVSHAQTAEDVDDVLNSILDTHNLNELYDNVLGSLYKNSNKRQAQIINEILAWVTNALEDLNFSKLKQALEFGMGTKIFSLKEEIERCGSLFEISGLTQVNPVKNGSTIHEESDTGGGSSDKILSSGEENSSGTDGSYYPEDTGADEHYWNAIVRIRHTTLQEYFKRKEQSSPLKVDQERVHELLAITCMKAIINVADEDDPPEFLKYAYHNWMEHLNKVTVDHGSVSRIYPLLSTIFRRWDIIKTWLIRDHTHCSLPSLERINIILGMGGEFQGNIPETITTNSSTGQHQNLAKSHSFLLDMVVETATKGDFFHTLPRLGDERSIQDYSSLIASFVGLYSAIDASRIKDFEFGYQIGRIRLRWHPRDNMLTCPLWGLTNWEWGNLPTCRSFAQAEYLAHYKYWAEAVQIYNSLTEQQPDQPLFLFQLARSLEEIGHLSESVQQAKLCRLKCEDRKETEALRAVLSFLGTVYKELGDNAEMLSCWKDAANLGDAIAVDELSNYFSEEADLESWMQVHLTTGSDACSKTIRRQSVLSKWHTTFSLAADVCNKTDFLIQSYKKAIRVISRNRDDSLMNCGCRFWLAKAYAYKLQRHGTALKLFRAIFGVLVTLIEHYGWQGSERTNLQVLTLHEISTLQSILRDQTVVEEAQNIKRIIEYERVIISLGKGMERYPDQAEKAHQLYQKVLRRSITYLTDGDFHLDNYVCLGNALIALGNYKDGAWACSMRCTSQTPPSSDSSSSGDEEKSTDERLPVFEWNGDFCNNCVILSNYTSTPEIEGYRYKCLVCAGMDLCEKCYLVFKEEKSESIALRDCKPDHEFLKLPTADWSREDSDAASKNRATPHIRQRLAKIAEMYRRIL